MMVEDSYSVVKTAVHSVMRKEVQRENHSAVQTDSY